MTGQEAIYAALALMHETDAAPYQAFAIPLLNQVIGELYETASCRREANGEAPLDGIPFLTDPAEDIGYDPELVLRCVPKGLAVRLYAQENDWSMWNAMRQEYEAAVQACQRGLARFV